MIIKNKSLFFIYIIYYLLFCISLSTSSCEVCKNVGEECISSESCLDNSVCVYPSVVYNETTSIKKCITFGKLNEKCYENQCADGLFCEFDNYPPIESGTCRNKRYSQIGEECIDYKDCSSFFANCENGICVSNRNHCYVNFDCPFNYYCNSTAICEPMKKIGENCIDTNNCEFGSFCSNTTSKCQKYFTLELNETCNTYSQFECNSITSNLYCSAKGVCEKYLTSIDCSVPTYNQNSTCNGYIDSSICGCDLKCHSLNNINIKSSKPIDDLSACFNKNNCTFIRNIQSSKSCIFKHCSNEYCNYLSLIRESDSYYSKCSSNSNSIQSLHICNSSYSSQDIDSVNNSVKSYINNHIIIYITLIISILSFI